MFSIARFLLAVLLVLQLLPANAQTSLDSLLERKVPNCADVAINAIAFIKRTNTNGDLDSTAMVVDAWRRKCPHEANFRAAVLVALQTDAPLQPFMTEENFEAIWYYVQMAGYSDEVLRRDAPVFWDLTVYTKEWASELLKKYAPGTVEYDLCMTYGPAPEHLFERFQEPGYPTTAWRTRYDQEVQKLVRLREVHASVFTGLWIPTGNLQPLGIHPTLGFQLGGKKNKLSYDLTVAFMFGASAEPYPAKRNRDADTTELTSHYFGVNGSIDFGWDLFSKKANEIQLKAGVGFDGFDAFDVEEGVKNMSGTISVLDLSAGVAYRRYLAKRGYLGLEVKYHHVNYSTSGIVDMNSAPITIRLIYGGLMNLRKSQGLGSLHYAYRR